MLVNKFYFRATQAASLNSSVTNQPLYDFLMETLLSLNQCCEKGKLSYKHT